MKHRYITWLTIVLASLDFALFSPPLVPLAFAQSRSASNPVPTVVPSLRAWDGGNGSFPLTSSAQIQLDAASAAHLQ